MLAPASVEGVSSLSKVPNRRIRSADCDALLTTYCCVRLLLCTAVVVGEIR